MSPIHARRLVSRVHYWAGWALGLFALAWFASGFFMSLKPISEVRGEHIAAEPAYDLLAADYSLPLVKDATSVALVDVLGRPAFVVQGGDGRRVIDALSGEAMPAPGEDAIRAKVDDVLLVEATVARMVKLDEAPWEYSGPLPVWQVTLSDAENARLYIDATTGRLVRVRTPHWRAFDIAWRVHILDPGGAKIGSWWLSVASGLASLFALSGLALLWRPRRKTVAG